MCMQGAAILLLIYTTRGATTPVVLYIASVVYKKWDGNLGQAQILGAWPPCLPYQRYYCQHHKV